MKRLIFFILLVFLYGVYILYKTDPMVQSCIGLTKTLESMYTEATPERLDLENAYFQMNCQKLPIFIF